MLLSKFFETALGDGARTNKYDVFFSIDGGEFDKKLSVLLESTTLPYITTQAIDYKYKGKTIPVPIGFTYNQDWECTFYLDENHDIKTFFESWIERYDTRSEKLTYNDKAFESVKIPGGGTFDKNVIDVKLVQYNFIAEVNPFTSNEKNITAEYMLYNVFPYNLNAINYGNEDDIGKITVNFKFSHYEKIK